METYIAILRGINVSGQKMIKMDALRQLFEDLKFKNIRSYIQSGNIIFESKVASPEILAKKIEKQVKTTFGFEVPVLVKDKKQLQQVLKSNPFVNKRSEDVKWLHVTFLSASPEKTGMEKLMGLSYKPDEFILSNDVVYLFCPNGYGNTKLNNNFFESKLKVTATTRNWNTVNELLRMAEIS